MYSLLIDIWKFIKNPIVLMFLFLFGFIQMIVILATINANSNLSNSPDVNRKSQPKPATLDWRFKTAIKVESESESKSSKPNRSSYAIPEIIQYGSEDYQYPLLVDMIDLVEKIKSGQNVTVEKINNPQFAYIISGDHICQSSSLKVDLLILIKSTPSNIIARDVIRSTWGKLECWGNRTVRRAFLFGKVSRNESELQRHISMESAVHRDIVQSDFIDNYYNNTLKLMLGLDWATTACRQARFLMFVDDDYFVQPRAALAYLESVSAALERRLVSGYVWRMAVPHRDQRAKWFVSREDYPWPFYPSYCSAGNFFLSMSVAVDISIAMKYTRFFRFDDVFLGIVLHKLLTVPMHLSNVFSFNPITRSSPSYRQIISSHGYKSSRHLLQTWLDLNCTSFCVA